MHNLTELEIKNHSYVRYANNLAELCRDLFRFTPITFFEPYRIYKNNDYSGLMSDGKWAEEFLKKGYQHSGIAKYQTSCLKSDYTLWSISSMFKISEQAKKMRQDCIDFNYGNGVTLIERYEEYTQLYYFGASSFDDRVNEYFINHLDILNNFVLYFEEMCNGDKKLLSAYHTKYGCKNEIEMESFSQPYFSKDDNLFRPSINKIHFKNNTHAFWLTSSEWKCVYHVICGLSSKQIAKVLNISHRTVESHIKNAKRKAECSSLGELINKTLYKIKYINPL